MIEKINQRIDVVTIYKSLGSTVVPYKIKWNGKVYYIKNIGYHHREKIGNVVYHIFSVSSNSLDFRLKHDPTNLSWILEEVSDGFAN